MLIDTTLLAEDGTLIEGLTNGSLQRFGGVLRDTSSGRIVKHLLEAPPASNLARATPAPNLLGGAGQKLSSLLSVSQVAAAAGVINLGVSVVGFAYMAYKLCQLQESMSAMQARVDARFNRVEEKLDAIADQLNYLLLLTRANTGEQRRMRDALAELHRAFLVSEIAELRSWLDQLSRFPDDSPKDAIRAASKLRHVLSDQAVRATPQLEAPSMLAADISIRGWAVAVATEANLLMRLGHHRDARQLIEAEHPRFAGLTERWAEALIADERPQLQTAFRFEVARLRARVMPERVERVARLCQLDRDLTAHRRLRARNEAELELEMSYNAALGDDWTQRQLAIAEYLDGMSEMSSRLETLGAFARECEARAISSSLEALPGPDAKPGIYALTALVDK